jgi:serine/threonine protein kinase
LLDREGALTVERAVRYAIQICEPLAEAHALGIVHRDIKPENLFLWSGGPNTDSVKVLDFGLAKQLGSSRALGVTGPQDSLGSPGFMSPEQVTTPQLVDSRTDVWSVGVVLYQLLTNVSPFGGGSLVEVLSHILKAQPTPLPEVLPGLDVELDAIVHRCLEKERDARYQTMAELAEALRAYLAARGQATILPAGGLKSSPPPKEPKIVIAGVHSRSPALVAMLVVLICGGFYLADRAGHVRLRNLTDGWLTARALTVGPQSPPLERFEPPLLPVLLARPTGQGHDAQTLRAVPERDVAPSPVAAPPRAREPAHEPMSAEEREERKAAYRDYLESEGLTPLSETNP